MRLEHVNLMISEIKEVKSIFIEILDPDLNTKLFDHSYIVVSVHKATSGSIMHPLMFGSVNRRIFTLLD